MKQILVISSVIAIAVGCQRGEEDPFLSLASRKARLSGVWNAVELTYQNGNESGEFDGTSLVVTKADSSEIEADFSWQIEFTREGDYTLTQTTEFEGDSATEANKVTYTETGNWEFSGGNASPSKSKLILMIEKTTIEQSNAGSNIGQQLITNPASASVFDIIKLSGDECKLAYDELLSAAFTEQRRSFYGRLSKVE